GKQKKCFSPEFPCPRLAAPFKSLTPTQPLSEATSMPKDLSKADLKSVAQYQKVILICILVYILAAFGQVAVPDTLRLFLLLGMIAVSIVATVFVFMLSVKIFETATGVIFAILTLIPCVGLIMLLIINGKATSTLKANGYNVGFLGADLSQFN